MSAPPSAKLRLFTEAEIGELVRRALLDEVYTTPKPGLVDRHDNGAHKDMDVRTFEKSTQAIAPYIARMYSAGVSWRGTPQELFTHIRALGIEAERAMFDATGGINTHKGIIFTLGIIAAALGLTLSGSVQPYQALSVAPAPALPGEPEPAFPAPALPELVQRVLQTARIMCFDALEADFAAMKSRAPVTHGEKLFARYGERGIRGQAQQGFPILARTALPALMRLHKAGFAENECNMLTLLAVIASLSDTNVLTRGTREDLAWLQAKAAALYAEHASPCAVPTVPALPTVSIDCARLHEQVFALNEECVRRNISPGGAADILAVSLFLHGAAVVYCKHD